MNTTGTRFFQQCNILHWIERGRYCEQDVLNLTLRRSFLLNISILQSFRHKYNRKCLSVQFSLSFYIISRQIHLDDSYEISCKNNKDLNLDHIIYMYVHHKQQKKFIHFFPMQKCYYLPQMCSKKCALCHCQWTKRSYHAICDNEKHNRTRARLRADSVSNLDAKPF